LNTKGTNEKNAKLGQMGREGVGSGDLLVEFWDPLHISGTVQAGNFKFGKFILM